MALNTNTRIKQIEAGADTYELSARYLLTASNLEKSYEDILDLIGEKAGIVVLDSLPEANATTYAQYKNNLVLVPAAQSTTGNVKDEYVITRSGTSGSYQYAWELVGSTSVDLSNYWKLGDQYDEAALSAGAHTHTVTGSVTVPTVSVDKTKKLGLTPSSTSLHNYSGSTTKLATSTLTPVGGTTTVATSTGSSEIGFVRSVSSSATSSTGAISYVEAVGAPSLTGTKTFNTDAIKDVTLSASDTSTDGPAYLQGGSLSGTTSFNTDAIKDVTLSASTTSTDGPTYLQDASLSGGSAGTAASTAAAFNSASVDSNGVLSFGTANFATNGIVGVSLPTLSKTTRYMKRALTNAGKASVSFSGTTKYMKKATTSAGTGTVGISGGTVTTKYLSAPTSTADIPTLGSATVATAGSSVTYATGSTSATGTGAEVLNALNESEAISVMTGVTLSESTSNTGPVIEHVTTGTTSSALTNGAAASNGAHTHNVKPLAANKHA